MTERSDAPHGELADELFALIAKSLCGDDLDAKDRITIGTAVGVLRRLAPSETLPTAKPERRDSQALSELKPDEHQKRSGEVDREVSSGQHGARSDAVGAGGAERGARSPSGEANEVVGMEGIAVPSAPCVVGQKLWLWKNFVDGRPEYWAFDNPYPTRMDCGDPQTLGEPCGYAIFKESRTGRTDVSEAEVIAAIKRAKPADSRPRIPRTLFNMVCNALGDGTERNKLLRRAMLDVDAAPSER